MAVCRDVLMRTEHGRERDNVPMPGARGHRPVSDNGQGDRPAPEGHHTPRNLHRMRAPGTGRMSRALAALAARYVGRRVKLAAPVDTGTISRIDGRGVFLTIGPFTGGDIAEYLDD